jgi:hypothetical protein
MSIWKQGRKWLSALLAIGAVAFAPKVASAGSPLWWTVNGQAGVPQNPTNDVGAWGNSYGHMFHENQGTNQLDFNIPFPTKFSSPSQTLLGQVFGDAGSPGSSYCAQLLTVGGDGSVVASPYTCAPQGAKSFALQSIYLPNASAYTTAFMAVWATGGAEIDAVSYAFTNYPYTLSP